MLHQVDELLRAVLLRDVPTLKSADQIRFQPPDDAWRTVVANLGRACVNVYLVDIRENRALRETDWRRVVDSTGPHREPAPARVDLHYLVSAWSPATETPAIEPTLDEHALLYEVLGALFRVEPLNPSRVYPPGSAALAAISPLIQDADLPVAVAPAEGWPKLAEFWGAMGTGDRWKPAIWLTVTVPVALTRQIAGPLVTTRILEFRQGSDPGSAESWAQIGGTVTDAAGHPLPGAIVSLRSAGGVVGTSVAGADGRWDVGALGLVDYAAAATLPGRPPTEHVVGAAGPAASHDFVLN